MITKVSTVRNKMSGQIFEVVPGTLLPDFFEEVQKDIKVGEPTVEFEVEPMEPEVKTEEEPKPAKPAKKPAKKTKKTKKGAKKNAISKK